MKRLIINADDFGLSHSVNEGVVFAHRSGVLTSATLMVNTPGFEEAVRLAEEHPRLGVGLHLNWVRGRPVSPPEAVPSLVDRRGLFFSSGAAFLKKLFSGRIRTEDLEREARAQVERALGAGIRLSHFDSEKNVHVFPRLMDVVVGLAGAYGIRKVRFINEFGFSRSPSQTLKAFLLSLACRRSAARLRRAGIVIADRFYGICNSGRITAGRLMKIFGGLKDGSAEVMVHPGLVDRELESMEETMGTYYINRYREGELKALTDPRLPGEARRLGVRLISFHDL
ncbi:MAG: ChbG/HpnK family deacetylase [Candidatus Aminicenantes bacterium]|nr:ChbG/HpnK family deacetylase [Candidatus Aminicenantes bacterium]